MVGTIDTVKLKTKFRENAGILKTADFSALKIDYRGIQKLIADGMIEKVKTGYYRLVAEDKDSGEAAIIARLFPDGVLCMHTALFYYGYSDRTPLNWDIAISKNASRTRFNIDYPYIKPYYVVPERLSYGVTVAFFEGRKMQIFDKDRLICECLKYEAELDKETFNKAIQAYISDPKKNIANLLDYAKRRKVTKKVHAIIGVWL